MNRCITNINKISKLLLLSALVFVGLAGCSNVIPEVSDCELRYQRLEDELQQAKLTIQQKDKQIASLQKLPDNYLEYMVTADKISLGRYTRVEDSDSDLKIDSLVVYLNIYDKHSDAVKVAGSFNVELWDLNASEESNMVKSWEFTPKEFETYWDGMLGTSYRFNLPVDQYAPAGSSLTVKCSFSELITGRSWDVQKQVSLKK